jgi:flagellar motility protein MotE (MotC chaperone)
MDAGKMNLKLKDMIIIAVVMLTSFPVMYTILLFATGTAKVVFETGQEKQNETVKMSEQMTTSARKDSIAAANSKVFQALQKERLEFTEERERLNDQRTRLEMMQEEIQSQINDLLQERKKLEQLVSRSDSLDMKRMRDLAKVYGAMKPAEAAEILSTLSDSNVAKVLKMINDDRQKAKILAFMSREKAASISKLIANLK